MPIAACSYFQYEISPGFMTFFYIALYTLELIAVCCRLYITIYLINEMVKCAKRTHKYEGGLLALQTPWGMDKSPECTQLMSIKMTLALPNLWCYAGTLYCAYITAMCHPGFGLLSSVPTGKLYFGSKWNEYPLMDRDYYTENYFGWHLIIFCSFIVGHNMPMFANLSGLLMIAWWTQGGYQIIGQVSASYLGNQVFSDPLADCILTWKATLFGLVFIEGAKIRAKMMKEANKASVTRICLTPTEWWNWREWIPLCKQDFLTFRTGGIFIGSFIGMNLVFTAEHNITDPAYFNDGDQGMLAWLRCTHISYITFMFVFAGVTAIMIFLYLVPFMKDLAKTKHLMSEDVYKQRRGSFIVTIQKLLWLVGGFTIIFTILMPGGMAMQVFGIQNPSSWPSITNWAFNQPGAAGNMMGAPVHTLLSKVFFIVSSFFCGGFPKYKGVIPDPTKKGVKVGPSHGV